MELLVYRFADRFAADWKFRLAALLTYVALHMAVLLLVTAVPMALDLPWLGCAVFVATVFGGACLFAWLTLPPTVHGVLPHLTL